MKITKYEHACVALEEQGKKMIIDPGAFTATFGEPHHILAVVITHVHPDHFDPGHLRRIQDNNPEVQFFTTAEVAAQFQKPGVAIVKADDTVALGPFTLRFYGQTHAVILPEVAPPQNIGVQVNDSFYYGGDSFITPETSVEVLAVPTSAPWLKISEVADYIRSARPKRCFPTHNALLSEQGHATTSKWISEVCEKEGIGFRFLSPGESLEI